MTNSVRLLSTSGILGYGFAESSLQRALAGGVDMVGVDGGSSDPGPYYLGTGKAFVSLRAMRRDLRLMLLAARSQKVPLIVGTCGGAGGAPHLRAAAALLREIAREEKLHFKLALIHAEQTKAAIARQLREGRIRALGRAAKLDSSTIDRAERIVGMMGPEPYMRALDAGAQVVLGGRTSDPAPFAAVAMRAGLPPAPSWYAGKLLECGAGPAVPKGHDCMTAIVRADSVECEPADPNRRCTSQSVATHSLHENASPTLHIEPGGTLATEGCTFIQVSDRAVRVHGMRWSNASEYTVKLEAVERIGFRTISIAATRDPGLIGQFDQFLTAVRERVATKCLEFGATRDDYTLSVHVYGRNGVMGIREPVTQFDSHELGIVVDVVASDSDLANAVTAVARTTLLHMDFPGRLCKEGNMAFPFSPAEISAGEAFRFTMNHVAMPADPYEMFPIEYETI